ncbi:MAG: ABC transporter substrate-binding protein [Gemmatimonadaceae bacterium]
MTDHTRGSTLRRMIPGAALLLCACTSAEPIRIGAAGNWRELYGVMSKRGIDLALEEINAQGGVRGRRLDVVAQDDSSDGMHAVRVASDFYADATVLGVVGHIESGTMVAAARIYDQGLVAISSTATSPSLSGMSPWVFRVISSDSVNGRDMAAHARRLGLRRAAVLYENNSYGRGLSDAFTRHFQGEVVSIDPIASDSVSDIEPNVSWARSQHPDVVFVAGTSSSGIAVLREAERQGFRTTFMGGDGWLGVVSAGALAERVVIATPFTTEDPRDDVRRFTQAFRARYGEVPDGNAALAYDATRLLARAIEEAGTSRVGVRDWLRDHLPGAPFQGVTGSIQFTPSGDVIGKGFVMTRVVAGALRVEATRGS